MRRVHRILHRLEPITIELRLNEDLSMSVFSEPDIDIRDQRCWLRSHICPVKPNQLLHWIRFLLHGQVKFALGGFRRSFQAIALGVIKKPMVRAGNPALFDATVTERSASVRAGIVEQTDAAPL